MNARERHLLNKFGITEKQYESLLQKQQSCCAICGTHSSKFKSRLAVDHDHTSGEVRGLLCFRCNKFRVGRSRRTEVGLLRAVIEYLDREYTGWIVPPKRKRKRRKKKK